MKNNIIAFSGPINSGKSTATNMMQYCLNMPKVFRQYWLYKLFKGHFIFHKWKQTSFATPLKQILSIVTGYSLDKFEDRFCKEHFTYSKHTDSPKLNDNQFNKIIKNNSFDILENYTLTIRQLMQWFGSSVMPFCFGNNVWVNATLKQFGNLLISDVRFRKEADAIHHLGGKIILIERPDILQTSNHISEKEWKEMKTDGVYDLTLLNNGSQKELFDSIKTAITQLKQLS